MVPALVPETRRLCARLFPLGRILRGAERLQLAQGERKPPPLRPPHAPSGLAPPASCLAHPLPPCSFPYLCSLRSYDGTQHICGATLIAPQLAVTAAYCANPPGGVRMPLLWCGLPSLHDPQPGSFDALQTVRQTTWVVRGHLQVVGSCACRCDTEPTPASSPLTLTMSDHLLLSCSHDLYAASTYCHDLALLELNASAVHAEPIPGGTLQPGGFEALPPGHLLTAVGWGLAHRE